MEQFSVLLAWILQMLCFIQCKTEIQTIGNRISPGQSSLSSGPTVWIDLSTHLPPSVAVRWRLYSAIGHRPVRLQIWRPIGQSRYILVAEHRAVPTSIGVHEYDLPVDERVKVKEGDKVGFTNEMAKGPVAFEDLKPSEFGRSMGPKGFSPGVAWTEVSMMPQVGSVYDLTKRMPYRRYSINIDVVTCPPLWNIMDIHCVQFVQAAANWTRASEHCRHMAGHLATPRSWNFASSLRRAMVVQGMTQTWLGLSYNDSTSYFTWMDREGGAIYSTHQWGPGEPRSKQLCVALTHLGHWATVNCSHRSPFVCQNDRGLKPRRLPPLTTAGPPPAAANTVDLHNTTTTPPGEVITSPPAVNFTTDDQRLPDFRDTYTTPFTVTCDNIQSLAEGRECLEVPEKEFLKEAKSPNRSVTTDIGLFQTLNTNQKRNGVITVLDLILVNDFLDALLYENTFRVESEVISPDDTSMYVQSLADVTNTVLSPGCNCTGAWRQMERFYEGPMDTVRRMEVLLGDIVDYMASSRTNTSMTATRSGIDIHIETVHKDNIPFAYHYYLNDEDIDVNIPTTFFKDTDDSLGVAAVVYRNIHSFMEPGHMSGPNQTTVNSKVISVTVHPARHADNNNSWMAFRIPHFQAINTSYQMPVCAFWDYRASGTWSRDGCRITHFHENTSVCECNHLTNFAVLVQTFDYKVPEVHENALSVVTYVGASMSVFGLLATVLAHLVCRCFTERGRILVNLCLALLAAYILFIFGIDSGKHRKVCVMVAVGLHYFYLCAFFWMLAQGIELYAKLRIVFMQGSKILHYALLGWGFPAIIVAVAVGMRLDDYGRDRFCWLSLRTGLIWSFIGPVILITMINFMVLCVVLNTFRQPPPGKEQSFLRHPHAKARRSAARAAFILLPVLGLTWFLGLLAVNEQTIIFQYLFAACNSSQGLLIFIFHCALNEEVRTAWRRSVGRRRSESFSGDIKSIGTSATGFPKSILKQSSSIASSTASPPRVNMLACAQSSVLSDSSVDSSTVSSDSWHVRRHRFSLAFLLPGRSKRVVISDPKKKKHSQRKEHGPL